MDRRPDEVMFFDETYSFADRERELVLLQSLLVRETHRTQLELSVLRQRIVTHDYLVEQAPASAE